jgi:hypothetical protein
MKVCFVGWLIFFVSWLFLIKLFFALALEAMSGHFIGRQKC